MHNINTQFIKTVYFESKSDSSSAVFCKICRYITSVSNFKQAGIAHACNITTNLKTN